MTQDKQVLLELLRLELKFLETGGYEASPQTPWGHPRVFEGSPACPNFGNPNRPHPCAECALMSFVPGELKGLPSPCRFIQLTDKGETIDYFYRYGTKLELEEALSGWLRREITRLEEGIEAASRPQTSENSSHSAERERQEQWMAFAGNLCSLASLYLENQKYLVAQALYKHAIAAAEKAGTLGEDARSIVSRIRLRHQVVSELLRLERQTQPAASEAPRLTN